MKHTPLYDAHMAAGGKLVNFAGWEMPIQYTGVLDEYHAVRRAAGLFDVSHMGRFQVCGPSATAFLQLLVTTDVSKLALGASHYSMLCNEQGGIKDDVFIYHTDPQEFLLCVNASNREKVWGWLVEHTSGVADLLLSDQSAQLAQLAFQGPASRSILAALVGKGINSVRPRECFRAEVAGTPMLITRTGYTGELGYELYVPANRATAVWDELLRNGKALGVKPAGLGARDLLRLDMAYLLYGNDINEDTTPLEARAGWVVHLQKADFVGRAALLRQRSAGPSRQLVGFELLEKGVPRHGFKVLSKEQGGPGASGAPIGEVASGNLSPILQKGIGLAYVPPSHAAIGSRLVIDIRGRGVSAVVVKTPFYKKQGERQ